MTESAGALYDTAPLTAPPTDWIERANPLGSVSLASNWDAGIVSAVFFAVVKPESLFATGGGLVDGLTVNATLAEAVPPWPFVIV